MRHTPSSKIGAALLIVAIAGIAVHAGQPQAANPRPPILEYIKQTWTVLTRSNNGLAKAAVDPKFHPLPNGRWPIYISRTEDVQKVEQKLIQEMQSSDYERVEIRPLPDDQSDLHEQGLLYLPHPYVVPGGRFNEMYGWDSYFIQVGLLRDNQIDTAKDMADNFIYEIREYGKILNANRTYFLSRSQPPFLTQMVLGVYNRTHDRKWLEDSASVLEKYYKFWTTAPHLTEETGLSRYFDLGEGPAPEVLSAEHDAEGHTHYDLVKAYFKSHAIPDYDVTQYYDKQIDELKPLFYKGDRSMRESGFDPSNRFGPFNIDVIHYDPVCLNSLLYLMEKQSSEIFQILGRKADSDAWRERAAKRAEKINQLLWDSQDGLYYDYNFATKSLRHYPFLTTFYPLWAGIASREQAARVVKNLAKFERPGGLQTSTYQSGNQWDSPFGWAPLHMIAVQGLRRYGYKDEADRITMKWLSLIEEQYQARGIIVEKYNVVRRGLDVSADIHFGYSSNEAGFGWTNAVFTTLFDQLEPAKQQELMKAPALAHQ